MTTSIAPYLIGLMILVIDQAIKISLRLLNKEILIKNEGIIFGAKLNPRLFWFVSVLILLASFFILKKLRKDYPNITFGFVLIVAGIISNLVDRLAYGGVLDYLNLKNLYFNFADVAIISGLIICFFQIYVKSIKH